MPNRIIKESIRTSKRLHGLSDFHFRLWVHLLTYVDDYGRGSADPELLRGFLFPRRRMEEGALEGGLDALEGAGCIRRYTAEGDSWLCLPTWGEHQRIQTKRSKCPAPPWLTVEDGGSPPESNPNPNPDPDPNPKPNPNPNPNLPDKTKVVKNKNNSLVSAAYRRGINPKPSDRCLEELEAFVQTLGEAVCLRAIDIAVDEQKGSWAYLRGILRRFAGAGVTCPGDVDRLEEAHRRRRPGGAAGGNPFLALLEGKT